MERSLTPRNGGRRQRVNGRERRRPGEVGRWRHRRRNVYRKIVGTVKKAKAERKGSGW